MSALLHHAFGWVCGQYPVHTWSPGGELLPLCQRCTGVYVGALVAALLHLAWRPAPTPRWLWLNGAFLLFIIPSGFYWIPQNPELRCASGILFGFGLVSYLWLVLPDKAPDRSQGNVMQTGVGNQTKPATIENFKFYAGTLIAVLVLTPLLAENGNGVAAAILIIASTTGALALAALLSADLYLLLRWLARRFPAKTA
jgi:uncharacterized membrane protein